MKIDWTLNAGYLITSIFSLAALIFTIITIRVTLKNRRNSMRENLYNRQLNILQEIHSITIDLGTQSVALRSIHTVPSFSKFSIEKRNAHIETEMDKWVDLFGKMQNAMMRAQLVIPKDKMDELTKIYQDYGVLFRKISVKDFSILESEIAFQRTFELEDIVRKFLHLDQLDKENRQTLSQIGRLTKN